MKKVFLSLGRYKLSVFFITLTVIGGVLCNLGLPAYLSNIINSGIPAGDIAFIIRTGGAMLILVIAGTVCNIATGYFSARVSMGIGKHMRSMVFTKVQYFSRTEFDLFSTSSLITRTNNDITQVQNFINMFLRIVLMAPVMCIGGIVLAYIKSPSMSMVLFISMPIMIAAVLLIALRSIPLSKIMQAKIDHINLVMREKLTGIRVIRAFGTTEHETKRFHKVNLGFMENSKKMQRIMGLLTPVLSLVLYGTNVALLGFGGYRILETNGTGLLTGDVVAVIQYVMQIMMSVMMLALIFVMYPRASVSAARVNEILETTPVITTENPKEPDSSQKGYLSFQNVTFSYPNSDEPVISNISFDTVPGETTAIIGSTGSGKSSLVNLILRFYDVQSGRILVNGMDVRDYDLKDLRSRIGYIPQKSFLFKGTIESNILFGNESADEKWVSESAKIAQAYEFITAKEEGFDSPISQGGGNVSGGQKQRLAITRAVVRKPEIYIFDDSFSALDFKTDLALRTELLKETKDSAVIIVAQRVSTIMNADRILVLEDGICVGMGTHNELLKSCKVYEEIVHSQLSAEEVGA